jgi:hypothetical protein
MDRRQVLAGLGWRTPQCPVAPRDPLPAFVNKSAPREFAQSPFRFQLTLFRLDLSLAGGGGQGARRRQENGGRLICREDLRTNEGAIDQQRQL